MMFPNKWRETIDPFTLNFKNFILKEGFPFEIQLPKQNNNEYVSLAKIIESTAGSGKINSKNNNILNLYATGQIDYETAVFAIKRSFNE